MVDNGRSPSAAPPATHRGRVALDAIGERLTQLFSELSAEQITDAIRGRHAEFDDSLVCDLVPALVERAVREDIAQAPGHRA